MSIWNVKMKKVGPAQGCHDIIFIIDMSPLAMVLHSIEYFIGEPVTFQPDQVTVLFFFVRTCSV